MKTIKDIFKLFAIWIISILALSISIVLFVDKGDFGLQRALASIVAFMFYSLIFSLPAFIFFSTCSVFVLQTKWDVRKKKALMILFNYIDIVGTGLAFMLLITNTSTGMENDHFILELKKGLFTFYPGWDLAGASTLAIILIPFKEKLTNK